MKILIAYATKTGTTEACAALLSRQLSNFDVVTADISKVQLNITEYDICIVGGSIRMGKLDKRVFSFIQNNITILSKKNTAYFICNGFNENVEKYFDECFPLGVVEKSFLHDSFGGELKLDKQKGLDKLIVKAIIKSNEENEDFVLPSILTEAINRFADEIKKYAGRM